MKQFPMIVLATLLVCGCAAPRTVLEHPQTHQIAICDAQYDKNKGLVGYSYDKSGHRECIDGYRKQGYEISSTTR